MKNAAQWIENKISTNKLYEQSEISTISRVKFGIE